MKKQVVIAIALALAACAPAAEAPVDAGASTTPETGVHMDQKTQERMGVRVAAIAPSIISQRVEAFARVLDVAPLAALEAEVGAAQAAAAASRLEYRRLASLALKDQAASARSVEAARALSVADDARATLGARRLGLEWGAGLERLSARDRARLISDVATAKAALVRVDAPGAHGAVREILIKAAEDAPPVSASLLGPAATTDTRLQSAGMLAVLRGSYSRELTAGRLLPAEVRTDTPKSGFIVPEAALVRIDQGVWIYVRTGAETFERRNIGEGHAITAGWFVEQGVTSGEQIVVEGAASLLAAERGPAEVH